MKIRAGFVSNSSSSSFIISKNDFGSVFALAEDMLNQRIGGDGYWNEDNKKLKELLNTTDKDTNTPVKFNSCNYDTFIKEDDSGEYLMVKTCNNHDWGLNEFDFQTDDGSQVWKFFERGDNKQFWDIEVDLMTEEIPYSNEPGHFCPKHFSDRVKIIESGEICCPYCYEKKPKIVPRKAEDILEEWI